MNTPQVYITRADWVLVAKYIGDKNGQHFIMTADMLAGFTNNMSIRTPTAIAYYAYAIRSVYDRALVAMGYNPKQLLKCARRSQCAGIMKTGRGILNGTIGRAR